MPHERWIKPRSRPGFTLVDLLVSLAIMTVLAAILLPVVSVIRAAGRTTQCQLNLHVIGVAYRNYFVRDGNPPEQWFSVFDFANPEVLSNPPWWNRSVLGALVPLVDGRRQVFACPSAAEWPLGKYLPVGPTEFSDTNYALNSLVMITHPNRIRRQSEIVVFQEFRYHVNYTPVTPVWVPRPDGGFMYRPFYYWDDTGQWFCNLHGGGGNLLFLDGHTERRQSDSLRARDFGLTGAPQSGTSADDTNQPPAYVNRFYYSEFDRAR